jgi:hypothetical protein
VKVTPCPSPRGTNFENLYLVKLPKSTPAGALDAALRRAKDRKGARDADPDQDENLGKFRQKLEYFLSQCLKDEQYAAAMDLLNEHLPGGTVYGEADPDSAASEFRPKYPDHSNDEAREYLKGMGLGDDDVAEIMAKMPRTGMESMNAAAEDRRRGGGRDRRHAMDSAQSSFDALFPDAARIKSAVSFR